MRLKPSILLLALSASLSTAHEDPADIIDTLTHQLEHAKHDQKAELYFKRATEYRALSHLEKAKADLITGLKISPRNAQAHISLGQLESQAAAASSHFQNALKYTTHAKQKGLALLGLSKSAYQLRHYDQALALCQQAISSDPDNISLILYKSHILWRQGALKKRADYLTQVSKTNPSIVIRNQWIDAMIDAGQAAKVKTIIHQEMQASRFKSSWQIRAARCEPLVNAKPSKAATALATAAITEINQRLNPQRPDITLLMDLATAHTITQNHAKAHQHLQNAKKHPHDPLAMTELEEKIRQ